MASATITKSLDPKAVIADGLLTGGLVTRVTWSLDTEANTAEIQMPRKRFNEFREEGIKAGKEIRINVIRSGEAILIFQGWLTGKYFEYSSDSEMVSFICAGPQWYLCGDFIKGKLMLTKSEEYLLQTSYKCIFNERIEESLQPIGNASKTLATSQLGFSGVRPFALNEIDEGQSQPFTINEMLNHAYKVGIYGKTPTILTDCLVMPEKPLGEAGETVVADVNIDGNNITDAIDTIMKKAGYHWWCRPISNTQSEFVAIPSEVSADETGKGIYLAEVAPGVSPSSTITLATVENSDNNTEAGRGNDDYSGVFTDVHVYGAPGAYNFDFTLIPGWETTAWDAIKNGEIKTIRAALREKSSDWEINKDNANIGRLWILNEAGAKQGTIYDFDALFGNNTWSRKLRHFSGQRVDGLEFRNIRVKDPFGVVRAIEVNAILLKDRAGVYISGDELPSEIFDEKTKGLASEMYVTLTVENDIALEKVARVNSGSILVNDVAAGTSPQYPWIDNDALRRRVCIIADQFNVDNVNTGKSNESQADMQGFAIAKLKENKDPKSPASFTIPWITTSYEPGDKISAIYGRNVYFAARVAEVKFEFGENQRTEIVVDDLRLANT